MAEYWIIGGGRVGRRAVSRLSGHRLTLVDPAPKIVPAPPDVQVITADGVIWLADNLSPARTPRRIIPALPRHLLAEWLVARLGPDRLRTVPVPEGDAARLPVVGRGGQGEVYVSLADFTCPDDCPEPRDQCPVTGRPRGVPLFERIAALDQDDRPVLVVVSRQLGPGLGGLGPAEMLDVLDRAGQLTGSGLVATACRCHGVVSAVTARP
ncbi:MAG: potassium transporter [Proteobacteria bacterium]|nr:potassium transporter [Pseudomonadota bacterium]MBU1740878.1 potassium transporter [Pseudomonadota bacterium]